MTDDLRREYDIRAERWLSEYIISTPGPLAIFELSALLADMAERGRQAGIAECVAAIEAWREKVYLNLPRDGATARTLAVYCEALLYRQSAPPSPGSQECVGCGKPATCIGAYEGDIVATPACDICCGHGNEDGSCCPIAAQPSEPPRALAPHYRSDAERQRLLPRLEVLSNKLTQTQAYILGALRDAGLTVIELSASTGWHCECGEGDDVNAHHPGCPLVTSTPAPVEAPVCEPACGMLFERPHLCSPECKRIGKPANPAKGGVR